MTSYIVQARYQQMPAKWWGGARYPTRAEAQAKLDDIVKRRGEDGAGDLVEARIVESPHRPNSMGRADHADDAFTRRS